MGQTLSLFYPPTPTLTETNLPNQSGKVFLITGGTSGVGYELSRILYSAGGTVYLTGRSESKGLAAISKIKAIPTNTPGELHYLQLNLEDLSSIKSTALAFTSSSKRLDVLFNNAGISNPPRGSISAQGHDLTMATNCYGPYLLTQLLLPTLISTAKTSPKASVRVVWTSSITVDLEEFTGGFHPKDFSTASQRIQTNYSHSKTGNWYLAKSLSEQVSKYGILSVTQNPGNLKTELLRHFSFVLEWILWPFLYEAKFGAYTELWAGLSQDLGMDDAGGFILPWGRKHPSLRSDLVEVVKGMEEGGKGYAAQFEEWCVKVTGDYR